MLCAFTYIAHTRLNLLSGIRERATLEKSEVWKHLFQHPTNRADFNASTISSSEN